MRKLMVLAFSLVLLATAGAALAQSPAQDTAQPSNREVTGYFIQGIPDVAVDLYADDQLVLQNVESGSVQGPFTGVLAGSEDGVLVTLVPTGEDPSAALVRLVLRTLPSEVVTILAHPNAAGTPVLSVLPLNVAETAQSRLLLYHLADASTLDLRLAREGQAEQVMGSIAPNSVFQAEIAPGTVNGYLAVSGTTEPVFGPLVTEAAPGVVYVGYAVGSVEDGTFTVIVQAIDPEADSSDKADD